MKTRNIILTAMLLAMVIFQACSEEYNKITGEGQVVTQTLDIQDFSKIVMQGIDDVYIQYGSTQKVEVSGHSNIINRIKTSVSNETWAIELEQGNYGHYDLEYYLTLPLIETIDNRGTGDVIIDGEMSQESIEVDLTGTGNYDGYLMTVEDCRIDIVGTADAQVTVNTVLDVIIEGTGSVYYKGHPDIQSNITGTGNVVNDN